MSGYTSMAFLLPLVAVMIILAGLSLVQRMRQRLRQRKVSRQRKPRKSVLAWRSTWGTVYVHQFVDQPHRFKVGFTTGLARTRQTGIRSKVKVEEGAAPKLRQVFAIDMHNARRVETLALKALDRHKAPIGTMGEFLEFPSHIDPDQTIDHIAFVVRACARKVRREALDEGRWTDTMEQQARLVRLSRDGRLVRARLFADQAAA